jgi:acetyltransferase-like isoleucine patch superfamily enzyme
LSDKYYTFEPTISSKATIKGRAKLRLGAFTVIEDYVLLDTGLSLKSFITLGTRCKIKQGAVLRTYDGDIEIGNRVSVGEYSVIAGHGNIMIGDCTVIAGHCSISASNHIFVAEESIRFQGETTQGIMIGKNVWIGAGSVILDGVIIGDGSVIGAGSLVSHTLPANVICFGVPCRVVKQREFVSDSESISEEHKNEICSR